MPELSPRDQLTYVFAVLILFISCAVHKEYQSCQTGVPLNQQVGQEIGRWRLWVEDQLVTLYDIKRQT